MKDSTHLRRLALSVGWQLLRQNGKHQIWQSASGNRIPLASTPGKGRSIQTAIAQLRRLK